MIKRLSVFTAIFLFISQVLSAQGKYQYFVDVTKTTNDQLKVELITPKINKADIIFYMPKIVLWHLYQQ